MAEIIWTPFATDDMQAIYDYIAKSSVFYANKFIDRVYDRVEILTHQPSAGRVVAEFKNELIRELIEGNYRIIYEIKSFNELNILRVHHSSRLLNNLN